MVKDWDTCDVRWALAFPDTYEIGMSNLGLAILYDILNRQDGVLAERVYAPWIDMEAAMRASGLPLFSLESRRPLAEFDVIGFSLPYEQLYTNLLNMLDLAGSAAPGRRTRRDASRWSSPGGARSTTPSRWPTLWMPLSWATARRWSSISRLPSARPSARVNAAEALLRRLARSRACTCPASTRWPTTTMARWPG